MKTRATNCGLMRGDTPTWMLGLLDAVSRRASAVMLSSSASVRSINGRIRAPNAVWVTPRGVRSNSRSPSRSSSLAIPFDNAGCVTP